MPVDSQDYNYPVFSHLYSEVKQKIYEKMHIKSLESNLVTEGRPTRISELPGAQELCSQQDASVALRCVGQALSQQING